MAVTNNTAVSGVSNLTFDSNGNLLATIIPRYDTAANLLAIAGGAGEVSSASDMPVLFQHTGVSGAARAISNMDYPITTTFSTGTGSIAGTIAPDSRNAFIVVDSAVTNVTLTISDGYVERQQFSFFNASPLDQTVTYTLSGRTFVLDAGQGMTIFWNGSSWAYCEVTPLSNPAYAYTKGYTKAVTAYISQQAEGFGVGKSSNSVERHTFYLSNQTAATTASKELTVRGSTASLGISRIDLSGLAGTTSGIFSINARIIGKASDNTTSDFVQFIREFNVYVNNSGIATLMGTIDTIATDANHTSGLGASMPTLTITAGAGGTDGSLIVSVTGSTVRILDWYGIITINGCFFA